ncbi:hypothetical protein OG21DRAFT_1526603, partial [Imleria badia]
MWTGQQGEGMESNTSGAMTRPTKRQRWAKAQRASGAKTFDSGLVETLLEVSHDLDYQSDLDRENEEASDISKTWLEVQIPASVLPSDSDSDSSHSPMVNPLEVSEESSPDSEVGSGQSVCTSPTPNHDVGDFDSESNSEPKDVCGTPPIQDCAMDNCHDSSTLSFLDMTHEDGEDGHTESVLDTIKRLTVDAKKYKSFKSLFHLNALEQFVEMWGKYQHNLKIKGPKRKASHTIAISIRRGQYFARKLHSMYTYVERYCTLPPEGQGKRHAYPTLLNDERIAAAVRRYLIVLADGEVNRVIIPSLGLDSGGQQISESTAQCWLTKLGGYELKKPIEPNLGAGECLHVPIFHNESIFRANNLPRKVWVHDGRMPLRKKGQGRAIHMSDFIVKKSRRLTLSPAQIKENSQLPVGKQLQTTDVHKIIYPGKNYDRFWTNDKLVEQVKLAIQIFKRIYPNAVAEFVFDQSSAHGAFAKDALNAKEMN